MNLVDLPRKYGTIIADPPWHEAGGGQIKRGADRHYPLMSAEEIGALPVQDIILPDAHLYLWVTNNHLFDARIVLTCWGFRYITMITWRKLGRKGLGQYFRGTTEHVLFARHGMPPYRTNSDGKRAQGLTDIGDDGAWFETERPGGHSVKPSQIHEWAEQVSPGPYLEMFARFSRPGWDTWGNEAPGA